MRFVVQRLFQNLKQPHKNRGRGLKRHNRPPVKTNMGS